MEVTIDMQSTAAAARTQACRGPNCRAQIRIVPLTNGNSMPIDLEPSPNGIVRLLPDGRAEVLSKARAAAARMRGECLYQTHFYSCPDGPQFRKRSRR